MRLKLQRLLNEGELAKGRITSIESAFRLVKPHFLYNAIVSFQVNTKEYRIRIGPFKQNEDNYDLCNKWCEEKTTVDVIYLNNALNDFDSAKHEPINPLRRAAVIDLWFNKTIFEVPEEFKYDYSKYGV